MCLLQQLIFIETPTNPLLKIFDLRAIAEVAKNNHALLCVDNTFLTPYFQRPLELGADLTTYSLTKYMNGHSDVIMGAIITNNKELHDKLRFLQNGECTFFSYYNLFVAWLQSKHNLLIGAGIDRFRCMWR